MGEAANGYLCTPYRIELLEIFDEFEEWHMIQVHFLSVS